jgi:hypothetical protein
MSLSFHISLFSPIALFLFDPELGPYYLFDILAGHRMSSTRPPAFEERTSDIPESGSGLAMTFPWLQRTWMLPSEKAWQVSQPK